MTLDPETKARIEAEEAYRAKVRGGLGGRQQKAPDPGFWKWAAWVAGIPLTLIVGLYIWGASGSVAPDHETDFLVACQIKVRDSLKAPSTARFGNEISRDVMTVASGYQLVGTVQAQNGFGAPIESSYLCRGTVSSLQVEIE